MLRIYLKELQYNFKSTLIWAICLLVLIVAAALIFTKVLQAYEEIANIITLLPSIALSLLGISTAADLSTAQGFLSVLFIYPTYFLIFQAGFLGTRLISRDEEECTIDFIYTRPIHRALVLLLKLAAGITLCLALNLVTRFALAYFFTDAALQPFISTYSWTNFLLQLLFLSLGLLIATLCRYADRSGLYMGWTMFIMLLLARALDMLNSASSLWLFTPFKYFMPESYVLQSGLPSLPYLVAIGVIVLANLLVFLLYRRKNLLIIY